MKISIIAAVAENYAIGKDNKLLCHLSADLKMFKQLTTGHTVIMGRRTFESLPNGPLPNRKNIVLSSSLKQPDNTYMVVQSVNGAFDLCKDEDEVFVIGGANLYKTMLDEADFLYITWIHHAFEDADVFFPNIDMQKWTELSRIDYFSDDKNPYSYSFVKYEKRK